MSFKKSLLSIVISIMLMMFQATCDASSPKGTVNILTWNGYLESEIASIVKNKCGVKIYYDEYYDAIECLQRVSKIEVGNIYRYDIAIIPSDIYEYSKERVYGYSEDRIRVKNSNLNKIISGYDSGIKKHYLLRNYPNNVVYFMLSLSGFVWNPAVINLTVTDDISSLFEKAKNKVVIIIESPIAMWDLIDNNRKLPYATLTQVFNQVTKNTDIHIANGYGELYDKDNFAFAFQHSGEAVATIKAFKNRQLRFLVHPKYSYITPDLMIALNARPETQCVAKVLASKEVLDIVQKNTHYLSPYGAHKSIKDPVFYDVYKPLFDNIHKIRWLDSIQASDINALEDMWIKTRYSSGRALLKS